MSDNQPNLEPTPKTVGRWVEVSSEAQGIVVETLNKAIKQLLNDDSSEPLKVNALPIALRIEADKETASLVERLIVNVMQHDQPKTLLVGLSHGTDRDDSLTFSFATFKKDGMPALRSTIEFCNTMLATFGKDYRIALPPEQ